MKTKLWIAAVGLALCALAQSAVAGNLEDGVEACFNNNWETAYRLLSPLAEQGHATVQRCLGEMYLGGQGVKGDEAKGLKLLTKAAEQGDATAQFDLGSAYQYGTGVPVDYATAINWYLKAAEGHNGMAQISLSLIYQNGTGIKQNIVVAYAWCDIAIADDEGLGGYVGQTCRDDLTKKLTPDQVTEAQRLAREWLAAHPKK